MSAAARVHGGATLRNGRMLVLYRGGNASPGPDAIRGTDAQSATPPAGRELVTFVAAVFVGSLGGLMAGRALEPWLDRASAATVALAIGTTLTGAAHAALAHRQPLRALLPRVVVAAPLAYLVMAWVHRLVPA